MFHEFAHSQLHNTKALKELDEPLTRAHKEAQAESVAYLSMQTMGIDTSGYSVGYISTWAQDKDLMKQSLQEIKKVFNQTLEVIEKTPVQEQEQEIVSSQKQSPKQNNPIIELKNIQKIFDDRNNELAVSDPLFVAKMELYKDNMQQSIQVTHHCKTDTYDFTNLTTKEKLQIDEINQSQLHKEIKKVLAKLEKEPEKQIESHQFKEEPEQSNKQEDKQEPPQHKPFTPKL